MIWKINRPNSSPKFIGESYIFSKLVADQKLLTTPYTSKLDMMT